MTRRNVNFWWGALGLGLALELAWCGCNGIIPWPQDQGSRVSLSSRERDTVQGKVGYSVGVELSPGQKRGAGLVRFLVIEGPVNPAEENYRGGDRVIFDAQRTQRVWLPVTRTKLINVNVSPPQSYYVHGEQADQRPLPPNFTAVEFESFLKSPEAKLGAPGLQKWIEAR